MRKNSKIILSVICCLFALVFLSGCVEKETEKATSIPATQAVTESSSVTVTEESVATQAEKSEETGAVVSAEVASTVETTEVKLAEGNFTIGINQFAEHGSLDNCRKGFIEGLASKGLVEGKNLTIDYQNAQTDIGIANQIAQIFVSKKVDLLCGIATPSAQACYNAASKAGIPVIYTAVTSPEAAGLVNADGTNPGKVTGTSDLLPAKAQLEMIREVLPNAKKIGILYTTSEANSKPMIDLYQQLAPQYGFELVIKGISTGSDIPTATDAILNEVDCMTNLLDNTVVNSLATILDKANAKKIPVFGSEIEQVRLGCVAAEGVDYVELGKVTGQMAADVLLGNGKIEDLKYKTIEESNLYINETAAKNLGITLPDSLKQRAVETF